MAGRGPEPGPPKVGLPKARRGQRLTDLQDNAYPESSMSSAQVHAHRHPHHRHPGGPAMLRALTTN